MQSSQALILESLLTILRSQNSHNLQVGTEIVRSEHFLLAALARSHL